MDRIHSVKIQSNILTETNKIESYLFHPINYFNVPNSELGSSDLKTVFRLLHRLEPLLFGQLSYFEKVSSYRKKVFFRSGLQLTGLFFDHNKDKKIHLFTRFQNTKLPTILKKIESYLMQHITYCLIPKKETDTLHLSGRFFYPTFAALITVLFYQFSQIGKSHKISKEGLFSLIED